MHWVGGLLKLSSLVLLATFLSSCQIAPTRVNERVYREFEVIIDKAAKPVKLDSSTSVLDARSAFEYGLSRISGSIHFPWQNLAQDLTTAELLRDQARGDLRLALNGLEPSKQILIVGNALRGHGEEGRLAWHLLYLGFQDVQVASIELFRKTLTQMPTPAPKNSPPWSSSPREDLLVHKEEFLQLGKDAKTRLEKHIVFIDVRSEKEYLKQKQEPKLGHRFDMLNIEWIHFYNADGRPNPTIRAQLHQLGVRSNDRIILVSDRGVRSASAAYSLMALGFTRVQNFAGGWRSI